MKTLAKIENPYPGLRCFDQGNSDFFYGRNKVVKEFFGRSVESNFLALIGDPGSGKSSFLKSGMISEWRKTNPYKGVEWIEPGEDSVGLLCSALNVKHDGLDLSELRAKIEEGNFEPVTIIIDRFEDVFGTAGANDFVECLIALAHNEKSNVSVIVVLYWDALRKCESFQGLSELVNGNLFVLPKPSLSELTEIIVEPLRKVDVEISESLVNRVLEDYKNNGEELGVLHHVLQRTYSYWESIVSQGKIEEKHYEAVGGVEKALSFHAEELFRNIEIENGAELCEHLFRALIKRNDEGKIVPRRVTLEQLYDELTFKNDHILELVNLFRSSGNELLSPGGSDELKLNSSISIASESLLLIWERLSDWVAVEASSADIYLRLVESSDLYEEGKSGLWRDPELQIALNWQEVNNPTFAWGNKYSPAFNKAIGFLEHSKDERDFIVVREERRKKMALIRTRIFLAVLGAAFVFSLVLAYKEYKNQQKANKAMIMATEAEHKAREEKKVAVAAKEEAVQARQHMEAAKDLAEEQKRQAEEERNKAKEARTEAEIQKNKAEESAHVAHAMTKIAVESSDVARAQKKVAEEKTKLAIEAKEEANRLREQEEKLRMLSEARSLAEQALLKLNDSEKEMAAGLALHAYFINKENGGPKQNRNIYNSLSKIDESFYGISGSGGYPNSSRYEVHTVAYLPSGVQFVTGGNEGIVSLWDVNSKNVVKSFKVEGPIRTLSINDDGSEVVVCTEIGDAFMVDLKAEEVKKIQPLSDTVSGFKVKQLDFIPGSNKLFGAGQDLAFIGTVEKTDVVFTSEDTQFSAAHCVFKEGQFFIASSGVSKRVRLRKFVPGKEVSLVSELAFDQKVTCLKLDPSGSLLAVGGEFGLVKLFDNGHLKKTYKGHISGITSLEFSPDRTQLASGSLDQTARLWATGEERNDALVLKGNTWIRSIDFHPVNQEIICAGQQGRIRVWPTQTEPYIERLCPKAKVISSDEMKEYIDAEIDYEESNCVSVGLNTQE